MAFDFSEPVPPASAPVARPTAWRFFPWFLVAGLGLVVSVNVGMAVLAHRTAPGLAVQGSFSTSNAYGAIQQEARRQAGLGWTLDVAPLADGVLRVRLAGQGGAALPGAALQASAARPIGAGAPLVLDMVRTADGVFVAADKLPGQGQWDITFLATSEGRSLRHTRRVHVP
jgi:nitrogen fixation protein FixH